MIEYWNIGFYHTALDIISANISTSLLSRHRHCHIPGKQVARFLTFFQNSIIPTFLERRGTKPVV
jgi:hypothetical protein